MRGIIYTTQNLIRAKLLHLFAGGLACLIPKISRLHNYHFTNIIAVVSIILQNALAEVQKPSTHHKIAIVTGFALWFRFYN